MKILFGSYRILKTISEREFEKVYLTEHTEICSRRVIKCISKMHPDWTLLRREAGIMQKLKSEVVPRVLDVRETDDALYLIEEYIEGETLKQHLKETAPIDSATLLDYSEQLCDILIFLHSSERQILYLDLKPENIIITDNKMKLVDFGSAICREDNRSDRMVYGTPGFCAPEQEAGAELSFASDIFALGKTFEYMLFFVTAVPKGYKRIINRCTRNSGIQYTEVPEIKKAIQGLNRKKNKKVNLGLWYGVAGITSEYESTGFAYRLAGELKRSGKKVLILSCNRLGLLEMAETSMDSESYNQTFSYRLNGIVIAKRVLTEDIKGYRGRGYDAVIIDFGVAPLPELDVPLNRIYLIGPAWLWTSELWEQALYGHQEQVISVVTDGDPAYLGEEAGKTKKIVMVNRKRITKM